MARIVGYIATSLDGYIVDADGGLDWLTQNNEVELGEHSYEHFIKTIDTVILGRATYDWLAENVTDWPYPDQRSIVVTSRPITAPLGQIETWSDINALIANLRSKPTGTAWMVGGASLQMAFIDHNALDELEIFIMPKLIGGGTSLFPALGITRSATLLSAKALPGSGVRLHYAFTSRAVV